MGTQINGAAPALSRFTEDYAVAWHPAGLAAAPAAAALSLLKSFSNPEITQWASFIHYPA
jgi:hypothetical protein